MNDDDQTKFCPDCRKELALTASTAHKRSRDALAFHCAPCARVRHVRAGGHGLAHHELPMVKGPSAVPEGHKRCPECGDVKPFDGFRRNRNSRNGVASYCRPCSTAHDRASVELNGGRRNEHLHRRYGITAEPADRMFEEQGGLRVICREAPADHVGHDHATDRVRGLLCFNGNGRWVSSVTDAT